VLREIGLLRLVAQRLCGPGFPTAADAVRGMTALQAQDQPGVLTSVALRTEGGTRAGVLAALDAGSAVRSWPMRGTLHLVAAEDLPWMLELLAPRELAAAARRRAELGLESHVLERARAVAEQALGDGAALRRAELLRAWDDGGVEVTGQRGYHLIAHLAQRAVLCFGPVRDGEQLLVGLDHWVPGHRRLEREEALGELAARYFLGHGPATLADFVRWTNLRTADARAGLALARPRLARLEVDGREHWLDPEVPERLDEHRRSARKVLLLPGFDEYLLGYADRSAVLPPEFAARIVPGGNGVFRPTVVRDGQVVGTWRSGGRGASRQVEATPFRSFPAAVAAQVARRWSALP
jgi:hypothetical protein